MVREQGEINFGKREDALEKMPDHYDAAVVLGQNWRKYPSSGDSLEDLKLSIESKMSAIAGAEMIRSGLTEKIILSSGKTAGEKWPSEAQAMKDYIVKKYSDISDNSILIEERSIDTHENAEEVLKIIEEHQLKGIALITTRAHLARAKTIFDNHGVETFTLPTQDLLIKRSPHYQKFIENYEKSSWVKIAKIKEWLLSNFLIVDPKGKIITKIAKRIRSNG